jgi:hypothetical protein
MKQLRAINIGRLAMMLLMINGCDHIRNTCSDYYSKKITIQEAARKLQIKLERSSLGDGIAWGTAGDDIDRYCNYNK